MTTDSAAFRRATLAITGLDWDSLGVTEHEGVLLWPAALERRLPDGSLKAVQVRLRCPSNAQRFQARTRSRAWAQELKLDLDRDADLVSELENYELLAYAIRDAKPPHDQHRIDGRALFSEYTNTALLKVWGLLNQMVDTCDPRFGELSGEDLWRVIGEVAASGSPSPLAGMPGFAQATFIVLTARAACSSPSAPSWLRSLSTERSASWTRTPSDR